MKRFFISLLVLSIGLMSVAQIKLTPQAQMRIMRQKVKLEHSADMSQPDGHAVGAMAGQRVRLVLTISDKNMAETFRLLREKCCEIQSRLGHQTIVSIPVDSVDAIQHIEGVERIDIGNKGRLKTDVTRKETGASMLNGPTLPEGAAEYTGKGVTVCLIDAGFDFQHPAFKDREGRSRIKCVYMMGDNGGNKFTVSDPEAGEYTFPGSVYDTPELIATLTTDDPDEYHGSHTANIAAGSISPQGFGGMAPEADLVLIPLNEVKVEGLDENAPEEYVELAIAFAVAYAQQNGQPTVLSASINSHNGPHDGTSATCYAISQASKSLIPVFSAGNEGEYPIHIYQKFTQTKKSIKTILIAMMEDETGEYRYVAMPSITGFTRIGSEVSFKLSLLSGALMNRWSSDEIKIKLGDEPIVKIISNDNDATLAKYFEGDIALMAHDNGDGRLCFNVMVEGGMKSLNLFQLTVSAPDGTEIDLWDDMAGFAGTDYLGLPGYVDGDSNMSAGDWTSTQDVVSVGAYCSNTILRHYDGTTTDTSIPQYDDDGELEQTPDAVGEIAGFSSYGISFNGVSQPTICAPGVNIASACNHTTTTGDIDDTMEWQGYPYMAESGTSMSCPAVSGIVALWLQSNPDLSLDEIMDVMKNSSRQDEFTAQDPQRWGYGKIDAAKGIEYILKTYPSEIRNVNLTPTSNGDNLIYDLQGRRVNKPLERGIYIMNGKKVVVR